MPYFPPQAAAAIGRLEADGQLDQIQIVAVKQAAEVGPLLRAIQAMKFKPATLNGKPIAVTEMLNFK